MKIAILDANGRTVRTFNGAKQAGVNRVTWHLRFTATKEKRLRTPPENAPEIAEGLDGTHP